MFSSLRRRLRRLPRYRGMLVIMLWQVPVVPEIRPDGSIGFMVGAGTDRLFQIGCEGNVLSSEPFNYRQVGLELDYDVARGVRIDAAAGHIGSDMGVQQGGFFAARVRGDMRGFGAGLGLAHAPGDRTAEETLAVYLRIGAAERLHFRMDINEPSVLVAQQVARAGVGWNATRRDRVSAFGGLAVLGVEREVLGAAAEITVPLSNRFAVRALGQAGARDGHSIYGFALGGRYLIP